MAQVDPSATVKPADSRHSKPSERTFDPAPCGIGSALLSSRASEPLAACPPGTLVAPGERSWHQSQYALFGYTAAKRADSCEW
jgi:hypothetical protein